MTRRPSLGPSINDMNYYCTVPFILLLQNLLVISQLWCRDDNNQTVDWHIAYKFPNSFSYASLSPDYAEWRLSSADLRKNGFLKRTFDQVYNSPDAGLVYGMYNDETPPNLTLAYDLWYGHMKGLFAFTENRRGFWLTHSVPKLPMKSGEFVYPETSKNYAQHFFCVSLNYSALKTIADHLIISRPLIQSYKLPESVEKSIPLLGDIFHHNGLKNISQTLITSLSGTQSNLTLRQFTKSPKFHHDLYSETIAPNLKVQLYTETWRHTDSNLPSNCTTEFWVKNIEELKWPTPMNVDLRSTRDHAKWAITVEDDAERWTCFGDINRSESQFARGGGALCVEDPRIWRLFYDLVIQVEACPVIVPWTKLYPASPLV
ncbi:Plancitoxin-1 [Echinococcus granulosus]|uniref:Plancitoxin-1 n=2 Tax=Echinococcus granulosus TaxID=6210 RepID=W6V197_ECHGR|nr:Plancitoxin-1 [Echinococcus granulosus]EUB64692.1 Plancitoxin-1 [Echinococcus granulosus]